MSKDLKFIIPLELSGERFMFHVPQPSYERTRLCMPIFKHYGSNISDISMIVLMRDLDDDLLELAEKHKKTHPNLLSDFENWIMECLQVANVFSVDNPSEETSGLTFYNSFKDKNPDDLRGLKAYLLFLYTLLRYVPQFAEMKESQELLTAYDFMEFKKSFLSSIEGMEKVFSKSKKQKG